MTPFGISLILVMATAFLPWTYVLGGRDPLTRALSIANLVVDTVVYGFLFFVFPSVERGLGMNIFLMTSIHILAIAVSGLVWGIFGQRLMRRFLATPRPLLIGLFVIRLCSLALALTFNPATS